MKKLLALMLAAMMLLGMLSTVAVAEEPVEITYFRSELNRNSIAYYNDTLWVKELENRLNIKLKIMGPPSGEDYNTAVNLLLVSGEYPDLLFYNWNNYNGGYEAAIEDGIIYPFGRYEEDVAKVPNWYAALESNDMIRRAVTQDDGTVVSFCHIESNIARSAYWGYAIRKDWLDRLNLAVPETVDELYEVLKAFKEQDANGNGDPNDEIPLSSCNWWGSAHPGLDTLGAAFTVKPNTMYRDPHADKITYWTEYNDGQNFKDYVLTMRKWYEEGLLDEEYLSQNYDSMAAKITGDKVGMFFCFPDNVAGYTSSLEVTLAAGGYADPELVQIYGLVPLKGVDGVAYTADYDNAMKSFAGFGEPTVITMTAVENGKKDKCLELMNYLYSQEGSDLMCWGVEGVSYTVDENGNKQWTELVTNDPEYGMGDAVFKYALPTLGSWPHWMSYEAWGAMNLTTEDSTILHKNYAKSDTGLVLPSGIAMNAEESETYNMIMTEVNTAVGEVYHNVITGIRPVEDLDKVLEQVETMGIQDAIDAYQAAYDRYLAK